MNILLAVQTRIKPDYLNGKEIDVFAYISEEPSKIIVCECKFRQKYTEVPIAIDEINEFYEKAEIIRNNEGVNHPQSCLDFWFVTNSVKMVDDLKFHAMGIVLKTAIISGDWKTNPKWRINRIVDVS